jgi:hypothetical protein
MDKMDLTALIRSYQEFEKIFVTNENQLGYLYVKDDTAQSISLFPKMTNKFDILSHTINQLSLSYEVELRKLTNNNS